MDLSHFDDDERAIILKIVKSRGTASARVKTDGEPWMAALRLEANGWLVFWDDRKPDWRRVTFTLAAARALKLTLIGEPSRWRPIGTIEPGPPRAKRGIVVYETDVPGFRADQAPDRPSTRRGGLDGPHVRPTLLIGSSMIWNGPETDLPVCRACKNAIRQPTHYCLKCDRAFTRLHVCASRNDRGSPRSSPGASVMG